MSTNDNGGWIVLNGKEGDAVRYRTMKDGLIEWTDDKNEAIRFARRQDADDFSREDEDAWRIVQFNETAPLTEQQERMTVACWSIEVEKALCVVLGTKWRAVGISIYTLIDNIQSKIISLNAEVKSLNEKIKTLSDQRCEK